MASHLAEGPGGGCLDEVVGLFDEGVFERGDAFAGDDAHGEGLVEGGDVAERDDAGDEQQGDPGEAHAKSSSQGCQRVSEGRQGRSGDAECCQSRLLGWWPIRNRGAAGRRQNRQLL